MPGADGYITYSTKLDNSDLEKDLSSTTKKIESLEKQLQKNSDKRLPLSQRVSELGGQLDEAKAKLASLQDEAQRVTGALSGANSNDPASIAAYTDAAARQASVTRELTAQQKIVDGLQTPWTWRPSGLTMIWRVPRTMRERLLRSFISRPLRPMPWQARWNRQTRGSKNSPTVLRALQSGCSSLR